MNDTPRTDAKVFNFLNAHPSMNMNQDIVRADFARDLERENAALREAARRGVEVMADEDYLSASEQFDRANQWRNQAEQMRVRAERAEAELAAIKAAQPDGWVSEQDAKIKRMGEALRVCDLALSKVSDGSTSGEFRKVYADALRDAGVKT